MRAAKKRAREEMAMVTVTRVVGERRRRGEEEGECGKGKG
jgi:hypothetical protein